MFGAGAIVAPASIIAYYRRCIIATPDRRQKQRIRRVSLDSLCLPLFFFLFLFFSLCSRILPPGLSATGPGHWSRTRTLEQDQDSGAGPGLWSRTRTLEQDQDTGAGPGLSARTRTRTRTLSQCQVQDSQQQNLDSQRQDLDSQQQDLVQNSQPVPGPELSARSL